MRKQYASMTFVNVMWGLSFLASKLALGNGFSTMGLALARNVVSLCCLVPVVLLREGGMRLRRGDILPMLLSGVTGITVYYLCEYNGLQRTSTTDASLILGTIPVLTMAAEAAVRRKRLTAYQVAGALLSLAGVAIIVGASGSEGSASLIGDLFVLGAAVVWVIYIFVSRRLRETYSSLAMNAWQEIFAVASLAPLLCADPCDFGAIGWQGWAAMLCLGLVCSALCYVLYGGALHALSPLASSIFINLIPLTTIAATVLLMGELPGWQVLAGGAMIVGSIFLVNMTEGKEDIA